MDVYVLNRNLEFIDICDDYISLIWTPRYFKNGDFELYLPATNKNVALMKADYYVVRDKDISKDDSSDVYKNVMIIEKIQVVTDVEEGNHLIVTGRCLKSILARRIIWQQTTLYGFVETALRSIITDNAINPSIASRKINNLQLTAVKGFMEKINRQVTGDNLYEFVVEVCTTYGIGWEIFIQDNIFKIHFYKGEDRSYAQSVNPYVVFSAEYDNLLSTEYTYDKTNYKNVALIAGEGEGLARKTAVAGEASGLDRYEIYVDSRNSSSNDGNISESEYTDLLIEEGNEVLKDDANTVTEHIDGQVEPSGNYVYEQDYFLGDIVEVINEHGISATSRIIEVIESEDETGPSIIPTFGTWEV